MTNSMHLFQYKQALKRVALTRLTEDQASLLHDLYYPVGIGALLPVTLQTSFFQHWQQPDASEEEP